MAAASMLRRTAGPLRRIAWRLLEEPRVSLFAKSFPVGGKLQQHTQQAVFPDSICHHAERSRLRIAVCCAFSRMRLTTRQRSMSLPAQLDDHLQRQSKYLDARGVNEGLSNYLLDLLEDKEQREYQRWLRNMEAFIRK